MRTALLVLTFVCAAGRVTVPVLRPAEINLAQYKTLGMSALEGGPLAALVAGGIEERLVREQRFTVVDRQRIQSVRGELQLASTDLADPKNSVRLGNLITAGALITGDVQAHYVEQQHSESGLSKAGVTHWHRWTTGEVTLEANLRLTDVSTGTLLVARRYTVVKNNAPSAASRIAAGFLGAVLANASGRTLENDVIDPPPDRPKLEGEAVDEVVAKFIAAIQPTTEMREVRFEVDDAIPQLQTGVGWAQHGDWAKAQGVFNAAIQDSERNPRIGAALLSKVYYDAALSYEYGGDPDKALPLLDKAYKLSANGRILDEMDTVKRLQADARRLAEQNATPQAQ